MDKRRNFKRIKDVQEEIPSGVPKALLRQAMKTGQLNLSNRSLTNVPGDVWRLNLDSPENPAGSAAATITFDSQSDDKWWEHTELTKLILASNKLQTLDEEIAQLDTLVVLDVHDNEITAIPESIKFLQSLQRVNLSHNKLKELPEGIAELQALQTLQADYNQLFSLPLNFGRLTCVQHLDLSHNELTRVPPSLGNLINLISLNLAHNQLDSIPQEIGYLSGLKTLDLTQNNLTGLPHELGQLDRLEQCYLRHNRLNHMPLLQSCGGLKDLYLGNNCIAQLEDQHLGCLQTITVLELRDNKLRSLPDAITSLKALERLDLTNNDLTNLPAKLGTLPLLKSVPLEGNPLKSIRRDIVNRGTQAILKYLRSRIEEPETPGQLGGDSPDIGSLQIGVTSPVSGKSIEYSNQKATGLPEELLEKGVQNEVKTVNLSKNLFNQFPASLALLAGSMTELNLGFNQLSSLSDSIGQLINLTHLDLRNNALSGLPSAVLCLGKLQEIVLSFNRLRQLPEVLYSLGRLENILAADNQIGTVSVEGLLKLPHLACLDLQNNDLMAVPPELGNVTSLRSLLLTGNPFRNPRTAILAKGTPSLLSYLRDRIPKS